MKYFVCFIFCFVAVAASSQQLPKPDKIEKAFISGSRSDDGKPGKNYWQNRARYTINITAAPPS
ncbi:MAG: M1 family peptidase, partial [Bacteroidota bacterium]|nr:M1 family peptidase [Bacteroidota bacterium]